MSHEKINITEVEPVASDLRAPPDRVPGRHG